MRLALSSEPEIRNDNLVGDRLPTGTRLIKGIWNADGYWWDLVLFDDGTKGFVATNWLKVI